MKIPDLPIPSNPSHSVIDSTKLQTYQLCPRKFFWEYLLGWRSSRPNNHLVFGSAAHLALEHIILNNYSVNSVKKSFSIFNEEYRKSFDPETDESFSPKTPARFMDMMIQYIKQYSSDPHEYTVYKTEFGGTVHLSEKHSLTFKMDTILRNNKTGQYFSLEHKTKGANYIGHDFYITHLMGIQCGTYTHVLNSLFNPQEVDGVIINCLCMKKTKTPQYILERFPIFLSNSQMFIWLENTKMWLDRLETDIHALFQCSESHDFLNAFPCNGGSCGKYGSICPYQELCISWSNPLQHLHQRPVDMDIDFWNPLEENLREVLEL